MIRETMKGLYEFKNAVMMDFMRTARMAKQHGDSGDLKAEQELMAKAYAMRSMVWAIDEYIEQKHGE